MEQTTLQKIIEQKADQIRRAIEQAIDEGAELQKVTPDLCKIDGVMVWKNKSGTNSVVLTFESPKIAKAFEPSKEDLAELADKKRKELAEIEQQLNERANE
jgi:protoporphyrinogen oxidase